MTDATKERKRPCPCSVCGRRAWLSFKSVRAHLAADKKLGLNLDLDAHDLFDEEMLGDDGPADNKAFEPGASEEPANELPALDLSSPLQHNQPSLVFLALDGRGVEQNILAGRFNNQYSPAQFERKTLHSDEGEAVAERLIMNLLDKHCKHNETQAGFEATLKIIKTVLGPLLPDDVIAELPSTWKQALSRVDHLMSSMVRIDACVNGCCLFDFEHEFLDACPDCDEERFKPNSRTARVQFRSFPLADRMERLFATPTLIKLLRLQLARDVEDGRLADITDGLLWTQLFLPACGDDFRNLAFALLFDGVRIAESSQNSIYPMVLEILSLPAWVRYEQSFLWLSGIVPGGKKLSTRAFFSVSRCQMNSELCFVRTLAERALCSLRDWIEGV